MLENNFLITAIKTGVAVYNPEIDAHELYAGGLMVQFQDRTGREYRGTRHGINRGAKEYSYCWARVWDGDNLVFMFHGPKYQARNETIKFLSNYKMEV